MCANKAPDDDDRHTELTEAVCTNGSRDEQEKHNCCDESSLLLSDVRENEDLLALKERITTALTKTSDKKVRKFYREQSQLLDSIIEDKDTVKKFEDRVLNTPELKERLESNGRVPVSKSVLVPVSEEPEGDEIKTQRCDAALSKIVLFANLCLIIIKVVASVLSGSLSVISSAVDSAVDLTSGFVMWICSRKIERRNPYKYPRGRTRLEPLAIIIVSVVMGIASLQIILESIQAIASENTKPDVGWTTISIMLVTIAVKLVLLILCHLYKSNKTNVLAQDQRNDCLSNTVAIICAYIGDKYWPYIDPIGAILVSLYICVTWYLTGVQQTSIISGRTASPAYINRILAICVDHHPEILYVDTIHAYHFGQNFLVEVDVVMRPDLTVRVAHDISEPLQRKIEQLKYVERAFVHIDYEFEHRPETEHKVV